MMNKLLESFNQVPLVEIFKLRCMLKKMIDDPKRLSEIRRNLRVQQKITYFDATLNKEIGATIQKISRTTVTVQNLDDGRYWTLPFYMLNVNESQFEIKKQQNKVDRLTLRVGESVGFFCDRASTELYGTVVRLNKKTASVQVSNPEYGSIWRVSYPLLFYVIEAAERFITLECN